MYHATARCLVQRSAQRAARSAQRSAAHNTHDEDTHDDLTVALSQTFGSPLAVSQGRHSTIVRRLSRVRSRPLLFPFVYDRCARSSVRYEACPGTLAVGFSARFWFRLCSHVSFATEADLSSIQLFFDRWARSTERNDARPWCPRIRVASSSFHLNKTGVRVACAELW